MAELLVGIMTSVLRGKPDMVEFESVFLDSHLVPVLNMVKDQINSATTGQIPRQRDLEDVLSGIKTDLEALEGVLKGAAEGELRSISEEQSKWLEKLRGAMYDISDKIYELEENTASATRKANMMKIMKDRLNELTNQRPISNSSNSLSMQREEYTEYMEIPRIMEANIIGRTEDKKKVTERLSAGIIKQQTTILPIYGIAGVGKTTLARMVFHSSEFKDYYCRVWFPVSRPFDLEKINSLISELSQRLLVEMEMIRDRPQDVLASKNILIVLDDLREKDSSHLQELRSMMNCDHGKMVVMLTTPDEAIANEMCTVEPYKLAPLKDKMCWDIIKQECEGFEHRDDKEKLERIGTDIAKNCGGVASAAKSLANLLSGKDFDEWEAARNQSDIWHRRHMRSVLSPTFSSLLLSYNNMPPYLQLCFAYCAILPRGHNIVKEDLIQQWIALGLVEPSSTSSATQKSEDYVRRLSELSYIQYAETPSTSVPDDKGATLLSMNLLAHYLARSAINHDLIVVDSNVTTSGNEYSRYAVLSRCDARPLKLSAHIRALHCNNMELSDDSFSFARCQHLRVMELKGSSMQKLPESICQLRNLRYLNLSGCSRLVTLPESFGDLVKLLHINLSCCSRLSKLPKSFGKLKKLVYLDLSFWSCFEGISGVFAGLTSLQHLNLAHPSCSRAEHRAALEELSGVLGQLTQLKYLNLSMFFNNIFYYRPKTDCLGYIGSCISGLSSLEHLDLSHNIFPFDLPESPGDLNNLHTLDLSGCIRLKKVPKMIYEMNCLKLVVLKNCWGLESCQFVVRVDDGSYSSSNLVQLEVVDCKELEISCLEKVKSLEEAYRIRLVDKKKIKNLKLCWTVGGAQGSVEVDQKALLEKLVPPQSLQCLALHGYSGEVCRPAWWIPRRYHLPNLKEVTMEDFPKCTTLPQLELLPNLQHLVLRRMASITRINHVDLSGGNPAAFSKLSKVTTDEMESLDELSFPGVAEMVIRKCPKLRFGCIKPTPRRLVLSECIKGDSEQGYSSITLVTELVVEGEQGSSSSTPMNELVVENYNLPLGDSSVIQHLNGLRSLKFKNCNDPSTSSAEIIQALSSLRSLCFSECQGMISLPEYLSGLTSLRELTIQSCNGMRLLLQSMHKLTNLKDLYILDCPELKRWCESGENKVKLAHIRPKYA